MAISFRVYNVYTPSPERMNEIREIVKDKPEHPLRSDLQHYEQELANPRQNWWDMTVYLRDGEWRRNRQLRGERDSYSDSVWAKDHAFSFTPKALVVTAPTASAPEANRFAQESSDFVFGLDAVLTLGIGSNPEAYRAATPVFNGDRWRVTVSRSVGDPPVPWRSVVEGRWDAGTGTGAIESVRTTIDGRDGAKPRNFVTSGTGFRHEPLLKLQLPQVVVRTNEFAQPMFEYHSSRVEAIDSAQWSKLIALPRSNGVDEIRGPYTYTQIRDFTGKVARQSELVLPDGSTAASPPGWLRWLGWCVLAAWVILALVVRRRVGAS